MFGKVLKILLLCLIIVIIFSLYFYVKYYDDIRDINQLIGEGKFEHWVYYSISKQNKITLMIHTRGWFNYTTHIYLIKGIYEETRIPSENFIKFPDSTGVYVEWETDQFCKVLCSNAPEVNNLQSTNFKFKIIVDREQMESQHKGEFVRYGFN